MSFSDWAKNEVDLALKAIKNDPNEDEIGKRYSSLCYESALKAFNSLMEDNHSGFSYSATKGILIRLLNNMPLTPIEGKDDEWEYLLKNEVEGYDAYFNKRRATLKKIVHKDGTVEYDDDECFVCYDHQAGMYRSNIVPEKYLKQYIPKIEMPYYPKNDRPYEFHINYYVDEGLAHYMHVIWPNGNIVEINRYFATTINGTTFEITKADFEELMRT